MDSDRNLRSILFNQDQYCREKLRVRLNFDPHVERTLNFFRDRNGGSRATCGAPAADSSASYEDTRAPFLDNL